MSSNPLSKIATSNWIGDGTEGAILDVDRSNNNHITFGSSRRGTPFNARLDPTPALSPTDNLYYEVEVIGEQEGNLAVGWVTSSEFQPGWKTRGMFYNGNLTNGSAGLLTGFGHTVKTGDKVGVYLLRNNGECKVVFYLNGRCLGTGFTVNSTDVLYPCLHLDGKTTVKYFAPSSFPSVIDRQPATHPGDQYSGDWLLKQAFTGPELGELPIPDDANIILGFSAVDTSIYRLSIKVANSFNMNVNLIGKMEKFDKIEIGPVMSTRMMPPQELQHLEIFMNQALETLTKMIVSDDTDLILSGPTAEMICARYEKTFDPITSYR